MTQAAPFDDLSLSRTLLRAVRAQKQLRSATEPVVLGWLRAILARQLANLFRRLRAEKRDVRRERSLERVLEESAEQISAAALKIAPSPSAQCRDEEGLLRILEAIAALPDPQRQAFLLRRAGASLRRELGEYRDPD